MIQLVSRKIIELEAECYFDLEKLLTEVTSPSTAIQCDFCNEICLSETGYMMHVDHHRLNVFLECTGCNLSFSRVCAFYGHSCQTKLTEFCLLCNAFSKREGDPYIIDTVFQRFAVVENTEEKVDIKKLAKSIEDLVEKIMNFKEDEANVTKENSTEPIPSAKINNYFDHNTRDEGSSIVNQEEIIIDLGADEDPVYNASCESDHTYAPIEDLLADSD